MVALNPTVKFVVGGLMGTTDTWSIGFSFQVTGGTPSPADMNGIANGFATFWATDVWDHTTGLKTLVAATCDWRKASSYYYPANSIVSTVSGTKSITPDPGTNSSVIFPPQVAMVASLETGFPGRTNRGRVYLPAPGSIGLNGQCSQVVCTNLSSYLATFLHDCNSATVGALSFNACIGTGNTPHITSVVIDSVFDTQRRRRDKQVAAFKQTATV